MQTFDTWWSHLGFSHLCGNCEQNAAYEAWVYLTSIISTVQAQREALKQDVHNLTVQRDRARGQRDTVRGMSIDARSSAKALIIEIEDLFLAMYEKGSSDPSIENEVEVIVARVVARQAR